MPKVSINTGLGCLMLCLAGLVAPDLRADTVTESAPCDSQAVFVAHGLEVLDASLGASANPAFSPEGLRSAFEVLDWGASEDTRRSIAEYYLRPLGNGDSEKDPRFRLADCAWNAVGGASAITASTVDHVFLREGNMLLQGVLDRIEERRRATVIHSMPGEGFAEWLKSVNREIEESTGGLIREPLELRPSTEFAVSNVMWFEAPWLSPFDPSKTQPAEFRSTDGSSVQVEMMALETRTVLVAEDEKFTRVLLPYADRDHYMHLLLPGEEHAAAAGDARTWLDLVDPHRLGMRLILSDASGEPVVGWNGTAIRASVFLPRFDVAGELDLSDHMKEAGYGALFGDAGAFTGLTGQPLLLSRITQDIRVRTREEGSAAAAVTTAEMTRSLESHAVREIHFNRPFLFVIGQASTGALLAMGVVGNPAAHE